MSTRLATLLARETALMERLVLGVLSTRLLVRAGEHRFLAQACDEVLDTVDELGEIEMLRAVAVADLAAEVGLEADATLNQLVSRLPAAEAAVLQQWGTRLRDSIAEMDELVGSVRQASEAALATIRNALASWTDPSPAALAYSSALSGRD